MRVVPMQSASYGSQHLQMLQCPISNSDVYQGLQHMTQLQPQADETLSSDATLMAAAAGAFVRHDLHAAYATYTQLLNYGAGSHAQALVNRSLVAFKLEARCVGDYTTALNDAEAAIAALIGVIAGDNKLLVKAHYRKVAALIGLRHDKDIAAAVQTGMAALSHPELAERLRAALISEEGPLTAAWLAKVILAFSMPSFQDVHIFTQHWAVRITEAEEPLLLSSRDGRLLRLIPAIQRLSHDGLRTQLQAAMAEHQLAVDARCMLVALWQRGKAPGRAVLALMRGYAYLQHGQHDLAARDALFALTYGAHQNGKPLWARAHALHAAVLEAAADNTMAALAFQRAVEMRPAVPLWQAAVQRLLRRIPDSHAAALQAGGSTKLEALLAHDAEEATPEFLRQRPKYYYYNHWMRERIAEHCGDHLPEPVLLKMLDMEAGELDLILNYPKAAQQQVKVLLDVYEGQGPEKLAALKAPQLTWDQVRALKPGVIGLGMGGVAPGEILPSEEQVLGTIATHEQTPPLLTNGMHGGEASSDGQPADSKAADCATAAAAVASTSDCLKAAPPVPT